MFPHDTTDIHTLQWVACSYAGCEPGLECKNGSCQCLRGSKNPSCRCSGNFVDPNNGDSYACKTGKDGVCVSKDGNGRLCIYSPVSLASGSAVDACPPGKELNSLAQCVCMPLSINADCVQKAPSNADASNVCAKFQRGCEDTYMVNYAVLRGTKEITKGISKVKMNACEVLTICLERIHPHGIVLVCAPAHADVSLGPTYLHMEQHTCWHMSRTRRINRGLPRQHSHIRPFE